MVIDDQMENAGGDKRIANLFTKGSHHRNLSVIYIVPNLFHTRLFQKIVKASFLTVIAWFFSKIRWINCKF